MSGAEFPISNDGGDASGRNDEWVAIQCDDRVFTLGRDTMAARDSGSLFAALFDAGSVSEASLARNHSHPLKPVVFDRDPTYVAQLLQFLRSGELPVDESTPIATMRALYLEAQYFNVAAAVEQLVELAPDCALSAVERRRKRVGETTAAAEREAGRMPNTGTRADVERALLTAGRATRLRWCGMRFNGVDFSDLCLAGIDFERCELNGCCFARCDLTEANLSSTELDGANFTQANMRGVKCESALAPNAKFVNAIIADGVMRNSVFAGSDFSMANLSNCCFESSDLSSCKLAGADLNRTRLTRALLHNVERQGTSLSMGGVVASGRLGPSSLGSPANTNGGDGAADGGNHGGSGGFGFYAITGIGSSSQH